MARHRRPQSKGRHGGRPAAPEDKAKVTRQAAFAEIAAHPLFAPLVHEHRLFDNDEDWWNDSDCPADAWALVRTGGEIHLHATRVATPAEWRWVIAHLALHLAFGHVEPGPPSGRIDRATSVAYCLAVNRFLADLRVGEAPPGIAAYPTLPTWLTPSLLAVGHERRLAAALRRRGIPEGLGALGTAPDGDIVLGKPQRYAYQHDWDRLFAEGLANAVAAAVAVAGGELDGLTSKRPVSTAWTSALRWFVSGFPLLGALAAGLQLVEDADVCARMDIAIAAVSPGCGELYVNPAAHLSPEERRFVVGHELLHAGLRHDTRSGGRDEYLWNVACDYVINGWLVEMGVGELPEGCLYDPDLRGCSAEEAYDRIANDLRRCRKLRTLRGVGAPDLLPGGVPRAGELAGGVDVDEFCRRALATGLDLHRRAGRGLVPAALEEAIAALAHPPIPWDVDLARWFDDHFPPLERRRTYARPSRRQSATPDIPRPALRLPDEMVAQRTFGVVLDTSGSMGRELLGKALGAIASYASTRDVPAARVVFCDAAAYDAGFMAPEEIAGRVRVRGRGGTVLQPGVDLLERAGDFPGDGPILVITDGWCDRVRVRRDHAWLIPAGARLPFVPRGPVFRVR